MATLVWVSSLVLVQVLDRVAFFAVADQYARIGASLPFSVRLYVALTNWTVPWAAPAVLAAPIMVGLTTRRRPQRFRSWSRRYAVTAAAGFLWALIGVYQSYVAMNSFVTQLGVG
jgi:hypothetical protein